MSKIKDLMGLLFFMNDRKDSVLEKVFKPKGKTMNARVQGQNPKLKQLPDHKEPHPKDLNNAKP
jgi:hypothetical protein